jgi:hypothetical protein
MAGKHEVRVSAQYSSEGEFWKVEVLVRGDVIASADRLPSSARARQAGEYLSFGIGEDWDLSRRPSLDALRASVSVVKSEMEAEIEADPASGGFMHPMRILRTVWRAIRQEQLHEFHREEDVAATPSLDPGWQWALKMGKVDEGEPHEG